MHTYMSDERLKDSTEYVRCVVQRFLYRGMVQSYWVRDPGTTEFLRVRSTSTQVRQRMLANFGLCVANILAISSSFRCKLFLFTKLPSKCSEI